MNALDIIAKKRDREELSFDEINFMVKNYTLNIIPDYQMSSFLMAIYLNNMTFDETYYLTKAMLETGDIVKLDKINGISVDKHSTGGVGDKTTFVVGAILAACGINVAKMSGRGLGFTGGTLDKLESIPGFRIDLSEEEFIDVVNKNKFAVIGQNKDIAPADKKIYALRDSTSTVASIPLIASSIMSKKLAIETDVISLDVKVGAGAFMESIDDARLLAKTMIEIAKRFNRKACATLTSMDENLGFAIGNSLEIIEAIETLNLKGPEDFTTLCIELAKETIIASGKEKSSFLAKMMVTNALKSGEAFNKFRNMVLLQNGDTSFVDDTTKFKKSKYVYNIKSKKEGFISSINTKELGLISMRLGAGRLEINDPIDYSVGLKFYAKIGQYVSLNSVVATVYANEMNSEIEQDILNSFEVSNEKKEFKLILDVIK